MRTVIDPGASKMSTSISISSELLREAQRRQIDISQALESHLSQLLRGPQQAGAPAPSGEAAAAAGGANGTECLFRGGWLQFR